MDVCTTDTAPSEMGEEGSAIVLYSSAHQTCAYRSYLRWLDLDLAGLTLGRLDVFDAQVFLAVEAHSSHAAVEEGEEKQIGKGGRLGNRLSTILLQDQVLDNGHALISKAANLPQVMLLECRYKTPTSTYV